MVSRTSHWTRITAAATSKHGTGNLLLSAICFMLYQRQLMNGVVNNAQCVSDWGGGSFVMIEYFQVIVCVPQCLADL